MPALVVSTPFQQEYNHNKNLNYLILHTASYKQKIVTCCYCLPWIGLMNFHLSIWFWANFHGNTIINNIFFWFIFDSWDAWTVQMQSTVYLLLLYCLYNYQKMYLIKKKFSSDFFSSCYHLNICWTLIISQDIYMPISVYIHQGGFISWRIQWSPRTWF